LFSFISSLIGGILFFLMIRLIGWQDIKEAILSFSGLEGLITLFLGFLILVLGTLRWKEILKTQGYDLSFKSLAGPYFSCFSITYLLPMLLFGGDIFRGYILKEKNSVPLNRGIASAIIDRILDLTFFLLISFFGLALFFSEAGLLPKNLNLIIFGMFFIIAGFLVLFYFQSFKRKSLIKMFLKINEDGRERIIEKEVIDFFNPKNKVLYKMLGLSLFKNIVVVLYYWVIVFFLGRTVPLFWSLSLFALSWLGMSPPISADLGSHDTVSVFVFKALGLGAGTGAAFAMIVRGVNIVLAVCGIFFLMRLGLDLLKSFFLRKIERIFNNNNHNTT